MNPILAIILIIACGIFLGKLSYDIFSGILSAIIKQVIKKKEVKQ